MKWRPIIFSSPMVRAILEGRKTQTRRIVKPQPHQYVANFFLLETLGLWKPIVSGPPNLFDLPEMASGCPAIACRYGVPGDHLWVREAWAIQEPYPSGDGDNDEMLGLPVSARTPELSRIALAVTDVRVQRLQDISQRDAVAEGAKSADYATGHECILEPSKGSYILHFREIWDSRHGPGSWDANPMVWAITFERVTQENKEAAR